MAKTIATTMKIHAASGAGRERCAFTVGRWDARRPPAHDTGEVCLLALTGTQCSLIFRVEGLFGGVWRSTSGGEVHLAVPGTIYRFTHNGAGWDRAEVSMPGVFADLWELDRWAASETNFTARRNRLAEMNRRQVVLPAPGT